VHAAEAHRRFRLRHATASWVFSARCAASCSAAHRTERTMFS
jgi:hypothetical protein